jgi:hypothetical protein
MKTRSEKLLEAKRLLATKPEPPQPGIDLKMLSDQALREIAKFQETGDPSHISNATDDEIERAMI